MNVKNVWLLSFLVFVLAFGMVVSKGSATIDNVEATDAEGQSNGNDFSIHGILITLEGDIGGSSAVNLGNLEINPPGGLVVKRGNIEDGGNQLTGRSGTKINASDEVTTGNQGEYSLTFILPFDAPLGLITFGFTNTVDEPDTETFTVQLPTFDKIRASYRDDDVFKNGETLSFDITLELSNDEVEAVTMLGDFRSIDDTFGTTDGKPYNHDPLNSNMIQDMPGVNVATGVSIPNVPPANWAQLLALETAVKNAIASGKLILEEQGRGDYNVTYTIPLNSTADPGAKQITLYGINVPSRFTITQIKNIFDNVDAWTGETDAQLFAHLNIVPWMNGVDYNADGDLNDDNEADFINLDNIAPRYNFAMINPFTNTTTLYTPPKVMWTDKNNNGVVNDGELNYAFKPGDKVSIMVQVNPWDLLKAEFDRIDSGDITPDMVDNMSIRNVKVTGDLSALLDPTKVNLTSDMNLNGIPDAAEVIAAYAGGTGGDDDFDKDDTNDGVDEEDYTTNGFYEPFMFVFTFTIDDRFKAASGTNPVTVLDLPVRFMIEDSAGNQGHYSSGLEAYDVITKKWGPGALGSDAAHLIAGDPFPVRADDTTYDDELRNDIGPLAHIPVEGLFPVWDPGHHIVANWQSPWLIRIDNWAPSVSRVEGLNLMVTTADTAVKNGAAVVSEDGSGAGDAIVTTAPTPPDTFYQHTTPTVIADAGTNVLSPVGTGNFIYEISGNEENLVSLTVDFPSDNDVDHVVFEYSETDTAGSYKPMKGVLTGDRDIPGRPDFAGNYTDLAIPGATETAYHDGINGDDDTDGIADMNDSQVRAAIIHPQSDGIDNDGDGLVDAADVDANGINTDIYDASRDEDEDAIMDEDECFVRTASPAVWTFDPVRIARVLKLVPGKSYAIKAFAYDKAGNMLESSAAPIYVIFNVVGKGVQEMPGTAKAAMYKGTDLFTQKFVPENNQYIFQATTSPAGTVKSVTFQYSVDGETWTNIPADDPITNPDNSEPFKIMWTPKLGTANLPAGYVAGQDLFIRALPTKLGNLGKYKPASGLTPNLATFTPYYDSLNQPISAVAPPLTGAPDLTIAVTDATSPVLAITRAGTPDNEDADLSDGALLAVAKDVTLTAEAIVTNAHAHDVAKAVFQYALASPDGTVVNWVDIPGTVDLYILPSGTSLTIIRAVSKWDTTGLIPDNVSKRYDLRCVAVDIVGNSKPENAPIAHVVVGKGKYAAFITDPMVGQTLSGTTYTAKAYVYNLSTDPNSVRTVIFQYQVAGGAWTIFDSVTKGDTLTGTDTEILTGVTTDSHGMKQFANFSVWYGSWDIRDLNGDYRVRALTEDDRGYINEGIEVAIKIAGTANNRAKISNFVSDSAMNPRVSKKIARDGTVPDITIVDSYDVVDDTLKVVLKSQIVSGTAEEVEFQYLVNPNVASTGINPKLDTAGWKTIASDTDGSNGWSIEWKITSTTAPELFDSQVAKLVYVRAVAWKTKDAPTTKDKYTDESNYIPFVGLIFEELHKPTCTVERIEVLRDGVTKDMGSYLPSVAGTPSTWLAKEMRVTGGATLTFIPHIVDQGTEDHRASGVVKVELYYKYYVNPTRDGDTNKWIKGPEDAEAPFAVVWNTTNIPSGKYDVMLVATDQVGNKSANIWNLVTGQAGLRGLGLTKTINVDIEGPTGYMEDPDVTHNASKLKLDATNNGLMTVAVGSSCNGGVKIVRVYYSLAPVIPPETRTDTGEYTFQYLDLNNNGVFDPGEPYWVLNPPGQGTGIPGTPGAGTPQWIEIASKDINYNELPFNFGAANVYDKFADFGADFGYYYYDGNSNGKYDVGEPVWKDEWKTGGNKGRYNNNDRTIKETVVLGGSTPPDEAIGSKFEDMAGLDAVKQCVGVTNAVVKWADIDGIAGLTKGDLIWVDVNGDNKFTYTDGKNLFTADPGGMAEPIIYAPIDMVWPADKLYNIPPTNYSSYDIRILVQDRNDSVNNEGNWGPENTGSIHLENTMLAITKINTMVIEDYKKVENGQFVNSGAWRATGNTVDVTVRVWPAPIDGAHIELWFRYDNDLYPGAIDGDYNGFPDNANVANSRYDGIDNDWDGSIDEDQSITDGTTYDPDWGEVNTWQRAQVTGGTVVTALGDADPYTDKWFEVKLTWDVSTLKDEFQYQIIPVVVDGQNYGVKFNYAGLPWTRSETRFPQNSNFDAAFAKIIVDHQGPYSYTQVVQNSDDIGDAERTLDSWNPLDSTALHSVTGSADDMIVRTNDSKDPDGKTNTVGPGNAGDETDNNWVTYDLQAKTVSIIGGLDYTKTFIDTIGGVEFQYRTLPDGQWKTLGYDYDPDYMSSFKYGNTGDPLVDAVPIADPEPNNDRGRANDLAGWVGRLIDYYGVNRNAAGTLTAPYTTKTQRIVEATWSLNNVANILDLGKFPWTNGTEYEFRVIAKDLPDGWGSPGIATNGDPATATEFDKKVVSGLVGVDDKKEFLRGIYWKLGAPFMFIGDKAGIFTQPHVDGANKIEFVLGPRDDGKDTNYWVDNIVPKASIIRVDETTFAWTPEAGVDPNAVANAIDANVTEGDDVLIEAIVNADPDKRLGASVWGTGQPAQGDISEVRLYGKSANAVWQIVALGYPGSVGGGAGQSEYGNRFTFRVDTEQLVKTLGVANAGNRDVTLAVVAIDDNSNYETLVSEIVVRVADLMGPKLKLGGLSLDILQLKEFIDHTSASYNTGISSVLASLYSNIYTHSPNAPVGVNTGSVFYDPKFVDVVNLDLNNFGNAIFPANLSGDYLSGTDFFDPVAKRPALKVSGEVLDLYMYNPRKAIGEIPKDGVTITLYDKNNMPVFKKVTGSDSYSIDVKVSDDRVEPAKISHMFVLSENSARLYLPTWTENGQTKSRFEGVKLFYSSLPNTSLSGLPNTGPLRASLPAPPSDLWTGTFMTPPALPFGDSATMTPAFNSKGEPIWTATMNLEAGRTYYYYFVVDTVGDTWVIPDPKSLSFDEGTGPMADWWVNNKQSIVLKNLFINLPGVSKIWVPGTPAGNKADLPSLIYSGALPPVDDEFWFTRINLDGFADGGYELRVDVKDSAGYVTQAAISKTLVLDRTPPAVDPTADIKVAGRVKANSSAPLTAVFKDQAGVNAVETQGVLFETSRETPGHQGGNTQEATSVWRYAISPEDRTIVRPEYQSILDTYINSIQGIKPIVDQFNWLKKIALDIDPADGWSVPWQTPVTDQNVKFYVRAVPFDDALNVQVDQTNQVVVWVDGTVPKAKILTASINRNGTPVTDGADGFEVQPTDKDVTLSARIEANSDGDLNLDGIIDPGAGENANHGVKSVQFEYTLRELKTLETLSDIKWYPIRATQYSEPVLAPNADGSWSVTWQVDFSKIYNQEVDQYMYLRAVAEDEVGNKDETDPILAVMVLNDVTGPPVQIKYIKGPLCAVDENALSPHLAVSRGTTDVKVRFTNKVAVVKLSYRAAGATDWVEIKSASRTLNANLFQNPVMTIQWDTSRLEGGKYELQAIGYDGDGNPTSDPHSIFVIVDYTEPVASITRIGVDMDDNLADNAYESAIDFTTGYFRYARIDHYDSQGKPVYHYFGVEIKAKADATEPTNKVEAKSVVLQYFNRSSATWQTVNYKTTVGSAIADTPVLFIYNKNADDWTLTLAGDNAGGENALGKLLPGLKNGTDGEVWLRVLAIDYACNSNKMDKGTKLLADANPPEVINVYSGGRGYEGGDTPTRIAKGGDPVDLWAKVSDTASGVKYVTFKIQGTKPNNNDATDPKNVLEWEVIGSGVSDSDNGFEQLWHLLWTTPLNQDGDNFTYVIRVEVGDKASNTINPNPSTQSASVLVEKDVTPPEPPQVLFVMTHARAITGETDPAGYILNEYNAADYTKRKMLPIGLDPLKYKVFDLYNDPTKNEAIYINSADQLDNALEVWVRTPDLEFGPQLGKSTLRQYENLNTGALDKDPEFISVENKALGRDPGINRVYVDFARDPNQDGDPSDITGWIPLDASQQQAGRGNQFADPRNHDDGTDGNVYLKQQPLTVADVARIKLRNGDNNDTPGYAYYWVMGAKAKQAVWNTEASVDDANDTLDPNLAADGIYYIRTWAEDKSGNGNPNDARRKYRYTKIIIQNQDTNPPANTTIVKLNERDQANWAPLEWKMHYVRVRTWRNLVGPWYMGGYAGEAASAATKLLKPVINNKFFGDIDYIVVEALDPESNTWVEIGSISTPTSDGANFFNDGKMDYYTEWLVPIDPTLVGDGTTPMRAFAVDNGGILLNGNGELKSQHDNRGRRNVENREAVPKYNIMVDNPRAQVVLPAPGTVIERGVTTVAIQAVPVELAGWDTAKNGTDVGQVVFLVKRKAAPNGGVEGPYILLDAKDNDLDGRFGEDPVAGKDYDKDGKQGEDGVDPSDTNEPYSVYWKVPDWLVIDDPQTEKVIEQSAQYWIIAVAGDSNTGPIDVNGQPTAAQIHWDNPSHIYKRTNRASLVTVVDNHPPRTRVLQVGPYKVPSETKMVVGKTVTVFAGDTEVDWVPPTTFPEPNWSLYIPKNVNDSTAPAWPDNNAPWTYGMMYPSMYNPDVVWDNELYKPVTNVYSPTDPTWAAGKPAEWRANNRVTLRYAGPYASDATIPAFPTSGQSWEDTAWKTAEADAIHMDVDNVTGNPTGLGDAGVPSWQVTNWVTGDPILPDGKYFITITGTDDIGHTTGVPVGTTEPVMPDIAEIYIKNTTKPIQLLASQLQTNGTLVAITNKEMERGEPLVLGVDPKMDVEDLDKVTFQFKAQHDYDWKNISPVAETQPYSVTLSPVGGWDGITNLPNVTPVTPSPSNIVLGAVYQFKAVGQDQIGNKVDSNIIELTVVDKVAMASIAKIYRVDGYNGDEKTLDPQQINMPKLTGKISLAGYTDSDVVSVTFRYRSQGATTWTDIEAILKRATGSDPWDQDGYVYTGMNKWSVTWDTTTLSDGIYEMTVVANTGENKSTPSNILTVVVDHNAYDIFDGITDSTPKSGEAVGGWTRRPVTSQNPILDPDQKEMIGPRGEVDVWVTFGKGFADLDMGVPTNGNTLGTNLGTALLPSLKLEYKESAYPNVGDKTKDDSSYWKPICNQPDIVYDAATKRFSTVWKTAATNVLNGYYDIRVTVTDEAGNVAYKIIAERVIVDNTAPDATITNIAGDTTLTYAGNGQATDTELKKDEKVVVKATVVDSLTDVAYVQFQVKVDKLNAGSLVTNFDYVPNTDTAGIFDITVAMTNWVDIGLATKDADPKDSYSLLWNTTGLFEGEYRLRVKATDRLGNMDYSGEVIVTVIDTTPPIASIVGYYPNQLHFLNWPKKYWYDTIYAATTCQADVQEVQFQYRSVNDPSWITIGVPVGYLETVADKIDTVSKISQRLFPTALAVNEAIIELFNWTGLWGTTWQPKLADGTYQLRAVAKDWSGNVAPELAPILTVSVVNGVLTPVTPGSGIKIDFTANLGGTGVGDRSAQWDPTTVSEGDPNYSATPTVVLEVESSEKPAIFVLGEFQAPEGLSFNGGLIISNPNGLVIGGEMLDPMPVQGESGKWRAVLKGTELPLMNCGNDTISYLDLLRLGGKLIAFATTNTPNGVTSTSLMMDDLKIYPITAELGTNGTAVSKDKVVSVVIPRAAIPEPQAVDGHTLITKMGLMITPVITPNTPKEQRLIMEPVGQAYSIDIYDYWTTGQVWITQFRPGFEPKITLDYSGFGLPTDAEAKGFVSVRYWDPQPGGDSTTYGGQWANDDIINLSVDTIAKKISFNLKKFGSYNSAGNIVPHTIYSIVLEKSLGRIDNVTFYESVSSFAANKEYYVAAYKYPAEPDISYMRDTDDAVIQFRIVEPAGVDDNSIRLYIDGVLLGSGTRDFSLAKYAPNLESDRIYKFTVPKQLDLGEGLHVVKIEAWDKSDAVDESNWMQLETTARFFIDRTPPQVVTQGAQKGGIRYFKSVEGAIAAITMVDEGVGLKAADLQKAISVDVFKWLTPQTTTLRPTDQGNVINYQRKTLIATSKPILEYADDYTPDGIDNETWVGIHDNASDQRHKAWRASYNIQVGQVVDGETYEVVFYNTKPQPMVLDFHNENAVYLYEDLTKAYLAVWKGDTADNLSVSTDQIGIVAVPATQVPDFYKLGIANLITTADPFAGYYKGTFLVDILGNDGSPIPPVPNPTTEADQSLATQSVASSSNNESGSNSSAVGDIVDAISGLVSRVTSASSSESDTYFVRNLVADTRGPVVTLNVPQGVKANDPAATVYGTIIDDGSGIANAKLVINGVVKAEKNGPISNVTLEYTFGKGEVVGANEIKIVVTDLAGNETVSRGSFGVQEMDAPTISDMSPEGDGVADATPTISAAYTDTTGIDLSSVTLTLNGAVLTDVTIGSSKVSYTPTSPLKAGVQYTVKLAVKDTAGVPSEKIWTFKLENTAPSITDTTPTGVDTVGTPVISAKFADSGTGINKDTAKLRVDSQTVEAQVTDTWISYKPSAVMAKGKHVAEVSVADVAGNVGLLSWDFSIEEEAPKITDVMPSGDINDDMPVISAKYSDSGTGIDTKSVTVTLNGEQVQATIGESQVSYAVKEALKPGVGYAIGISVADKAGNIASATGNFKLEGTKPVISGMSPTGTVQSIDVAVSANYSDAGSGVDITTALMKVDGVVVNANASASGISYQATNLTHGEHTVYVEVADEFGNVSSQNWTFKVEETPPAISVVEPNGEVNTATPVLKAAYSDSGTGINVSSVVLSLNGQILPAIATASQVSYEILTPLEKGVTYKVSVQVADKAGNIASADASFSLETKAPTISGTNPTGTVAEDEAAKGVMVTAKLADDGSGVNPESVKMWLDGAPVAVNATAENATYTAKGLGYGEHNVRLVVADMLGNVADTSWKFSVADSTPPTVTVVSPKQDAVVGVRPVIRISYADEGSGVDLTSITVKIDDQPVAAGAMAPAKPGDAKVVSAGESSYEVKLAYGSHSLTVAVKDVAGNEATAEVKFMVEGDVLELVKAHNYPNPFRGDATKITFGLSKRSQISIRVYDFTNTLVATVAEDETRDAGEKVEFAWDGTTDAGGGRQLANGVYFCQVLSKTDSETKSEIIKIALVRE